MAPLAEYLMRADTDDRTFALQSLAQVVPLHTAPLSQERATLLDWALAAAAAAEKRVADLQARLLHLESLSVTDELTGAVNRRGFMADLRRTLANAKRSGQSGVLTVVDLNGFKDVNDRYGHNAGDEVLRQVTALMMRKVRGTDTVARLGGDEFALLMPGTTLAAARRKAQCLSKGIGGLKLPLAGAPITLSASVGFALFDGTEEPEDILHRADMAMYEEKRRRSNLRALAS